MITGRTGIGKTTLLRALAAEGDLEPVWCPAVDLVERVVEALRCDRYAALRAALATDPRPHVVEHLEDLREKPSTREELRHLLLFRAANGGASILTLTAGRDDAEIVRWLGGWAEVVSLDGKAGRPPRTALISARACASRPREPPRGLP